MVWIYKFLFYLWAKYIIDFNIINYEKDSKDIRQFAFVWSNTILRVYIKPMTVNIIPSVIASTSFIALYFVTKKWLLIV